MRTLLFSLLIAGVAAPAWAQPAQTPASFVSLDRQDRRTKILGTFGWNNLEADDITGLRLDFYGQYMTREGVGGYIDFPISFSLIDGEDDEAALGNLELGGNFALDRSPFLVHVGLMLPTASDSFEDAFANFSAIGVRFNDLPSITIDTWWLRLGGSYADQAQNVFWRVDAGVDVPFDDDDGADSDPLFRVHGALGFLIPSSALMIELTNFIAQDAPINDDEVLNLLTLAWRYTGGPMRPSIAITLPIDDDVQSYMEWALIFQLEYLFPR